jgi:hypothetical protein
LAILHEALKEVVCKVVYHGAGKSGKTTSLMSMNDQLPASRKGRFVSLETPTERTLFFDFMPVKAEARGWKFRYLLFATPGQEYYEASRRLVLKGADAIVFIVDSQRDRYEDNYRAMELLTRDLQSLGQAIEHIPMVVAYNKRDLGNALTIDDLEKRYNQRHCISMPCVAKNGQGVLDVFLTAAKMGLTRLSQKGAEANMGEFFRSLVVTSEDSEAVGTRLAQLNSRAGALGSVLVDESTGVIGARGQIPAEDHESLGALLACNFTAAQELSVNLSARGFLGITQRGHKLALRAVRVDKRRFVAMVLERDADQAKVKEAVTYCKGPLAAYMGQVDMMSGARMARLGELFSSVADLAVDGMMAA